MIGGQDILISVASGIEAMDVALRKAAAMWPDAVFEDAQTGKISACLADLDLRRQREILVYRDREAAEKWDELGADESLVGTMVHLLSGDSNITIVVDSSPPAPIKA